MKIYILYPPDVEELLGLSFVLFGVDSYSSVFNVQLSGFTVERGSV